MGVLNRLIISLWSSPRRARVLELVLLAPLGTLLLLAAALWAQHVHLALRLQLAAERAAAAAAPAASLYDGERTARVVIDQELARARLPQSAAAVFLERRADDLVLELAYEAPRESFAPLALLLPAPPSTIVRAARVKVAAR